MSSLNGISSLFTRTAASPGGHEAAGAGMAIVRGKWNCGIEGPLHPSFEHSEFAKNLLQQLPEMDVAEWIAPIASPGPR